jgi:hypothetical protein
MRALLLVAAVPVLLDNRVGDAEKRRKLRKRMKKYVERAW